MDLSVGNNEFGYAALTVYFCHIGRSRIPLRLIMKLNQGSIGFACAELPFSTG